MYVHTHVLELQKICAILLKLVRKALSHFWNGHLLVKKVNPFPALENLTSHSGKKSPGNI